ncbi:conserved protein, unknown function [Plasmodium knowlesi strain H]|nr:conserved protein, unknown function [Plasmodium knowlesi strain H]OTN66595.1 Uncharacterized protein PKNOH_S08484500 [Plasmodium knowlesi]CAA9986882.1 conserved protein, unknown function [Plasmodium knowlesi strain H]VVS76356.1 conserved protein, unknown function [Plasmodium knowlesi strain H]|eukprot:XP_002260635.1 hypothetical protein, conserved in Plasmodium species [Plasmodium knowlesi strain H]
MAGLPLRVGRSLKIRRGQFPNSRSLSSCSKGEAYQRNGINVQHTYRESDVYRQYDHLLNIGRKTPEQVIKLLTDISRERKCDAEVVKTITNHLYDFCEDFFPPQLVKILEIYAKLKYSNETLLGVVCNRVNDLINIRSCLRVKIMTNIYKQLNLHHPVVKSPLISQLNRNINDYKNELVSIVKNISYLYVDADTSANIINRILTNYDYYDKDGFTILEACSRLDDPHEVLIELVNRKVKELHTNGNSCRFKDFVKFLSAYRRLGLKENTYIHTQFEKKINNIKLLPPENISYVLLLLLSSKIRHEGLFDLVIINIENFVNNKNEQLSLEEKNLYAIPQGKKCDGENSHKEHTRRNTYNPYILHFLPFHLLLLTLLNYGEKSTLKHLLNLCVLDYLHLYDTSSLIKLLHVCTLLSMDGEETNKKAHIHELEETAQEIFLALQHVYKSATINEMKILYDCFLYHQKLVEKNSKLVKLHDELLHTECLSLLPSSYDNLNFENLKIIRCASSSYLQEKINNKIYFYLNRNDFFSSDECGYENLLLSVKLRANILRKKYEGIHTVEMVYPGVATESGHISQG